MQILQTQRDAQGSALALRLSYLTGKCYECLEYKYENYMTSTQEIVSSAVAKICHVQQQIITRYSRIHNIDLTCHWQMLRIPVMGHTVGQQWYGWIT